MSLASRIADLATAVGVDIKALTAGKAPTLHDHSVDSIVDATTVGKDVLTAASKTAARASIDAGTSNLQIGTGPTTALAGNTAFVPPTRTVAGKALSSNVTLAKADVGLPNVDNTSDASKPVSTAQAAALVPKAGVWVHNGTSYVRPTAEVDLHIGPADPGAVPDGDVWVRHA